MSKIFKYVKTFLVGLAFSFFGYCYIQNIINGIIHFISVGSAASCWGGVGHFWLGTVEICASLIVIYFVGL